MTNRFLARVLVAALLISLGAGCASTVQVKRYYTLQAVTAAAEAQPLDLPGGLGIGPVELPELMTGLNIVSVVGGQQVQKSPDHLWAGDLQRAISRVIADNLSRRLALDDVSPFPWDTRHRPQRQISVLIEALQGELGGSVTLAVKWSLLDQQGQHLVDVGRAQFTVDTADASHASYVAAINSVIHQFSLRLEAEVRQHWQGHSS
ncbi:MAG: membrane integrity-associated transporter subunit PqiC [Lysobacterales bacterium]